jgi:hypothetical protein
VEESTLPDQGAAAGGCRHITSGVGCGQISKVIRLSSSPALTTRVTP